MALNLKQGQPIVCVDEDGNQWRGYVHRVTEIDDIHNDGSGHDFIRYVATIQHMTGKDKEEVTECGILASLGVQAQS